MFEAWGRFLYRGRRLVLVASLLFAVFAGIWGTGVFSKLTSGDDFTPPNSQSHQEANLADRTFGRNAADVVVLFRSASLTVADPGYRQAVISGLAGLPRGDVVQAQTYWSTGSQNLVSKDRHETYAVLRLAGADDAARQQAYKHIKNDLSAILQGSGQGRAAAGSGQGTVATGSERAARQGARAVTARIGGDVPTEAAINAEVSANIAKAEGFSMPVLLILLFLIFGSLAAASLPLAIGGLAILGSFTVLRLLTLVTSVSVYSLNITTILGVGLGIDYGLFMVSRFREELSRQPGVQAAVARTVATAGRTVAVSGITVAVALTSLMLFPETFLRSMGYGGVATVLVDMIAALTVLPALFAVLGHRVNAVRIRRRARLGEPGQGWARIAQGVMRRPAAIAAVIAIALLALGAPFLRINWGGTDARTLPATSTERIVQAQLDGDFPANSTAPIEVLVNGRTTTAALAAFQHRIEAVGGVTSAQLTGRTAGAARIDVGYRPASTSSAARQIVTGIRDISPPPGTAVLVGGTTAGLVDELASLGATLPWMALLVGMSTFILLFLAFGSVVLPLKAIVMNVLSLGATFGVIVWIFQWGHLSGLLQFTPTGSIDPTMPILMTAIIFGLSMDYEVFLLSRIREIYDQTGDNTAAVAGGLQRTGGMITSLALLLIIVVGAFSASGITFIKLTGVGMIVALVIDASVVRVLLVPAAMRLLGRANWWAPRPLRRLYARYGLKEEASPRAPQLV